MKPRWTVAWRQLIAGAGLVLLLFLIAMYGGAFLRSRPGGIVGLHATYIHPGDRIKIYQSTEEVKAYITSEKGIGRIDLTRTQEPPRTLTLFFQLGGLEEMAFAWEDVRVLAHVSSIDGSVHEELALGTGEPTPISDASSYWLPLRIEAETPVSFPLTSGHFVIEAPRAFLDEAPGEFSLSWIDFYR